MTCPCRIILLLWRGIQIEFAVPSQGFLEEFRGLIQSNKPRPGPSADFNAVIRFVSTLAIWIRFTPKSSADALLTSLLRL